MSLAKLKQELQEIGSLASQSTPNTSIASHATNWTTLTSKAVPAGRHAHIAEIRLSCATLAVVKSVRFRLKVGKSIITGYDEMYIPAEKTDNIYSTPEVATENQTIAIQVFNDSGAAAEVTAGFTCPMFGRG